MKINLPVLPVLERRFCAGGVSTLSALGLIFVAAKLWGAVDWSWWWVTLPFWGPPAVGLITIAAGSLTLAAFLLGKRWTRRWKRIRPR